MNEQNEYNMSLLGASELSHAWIQPSSLLFGHKRNISSLSLLSLPEMSLQPSISSEVELFGEPQELAIQEKAKAGDFEHEDDAESEIKLTPPSTSTSFVVQGATIGRCCAKNQRIGEPKRSRTTQVHNASERRRRDKITEKIKALQDLMPHCRKKDKASVLEEAAHYVKTLQLQVETMTKTKTKTKTREEWIAKYSMQCVGTPCMMPYGATTIRPPPGPIPIPIPIPIPMMGMTFGQPPSFVPCIHALPFSHSMLPAFPLPAAAAAAASASTSLCPPPLPPATVTNSIL